MKYIAKDLLEALRVLRVAVPRVTAKPILQYVALDGETARATDLDIAVRVPLHAEGAAAKVLAPPRALDALAKGAQEIEISEVEPGQVSVSNGSRRGSFQTGAFEDYPAFPEPKQLKESGEASFAAFRDACAFTEAVVLNSEDRGGRHSMAAFALNWTTREIQATDGRRAHAVSLGTGDVDDFVDLVPPLLGEIVLEADAVVADDDATVQVFHTVPAGSVVIRCGGLEISARSVEGSFPDLADVWSRLPKDPISYVVRVNDLWVSLKDLAASASRKEMTITLIPEKDNLRLLIKGPDVRIESSVLRAADDADVDRVNLCARYFVDVVRALRNRRVAEATLSWASSDPYQPLFCVARREERCYRAAIMPIRIGD